MREELFELSLLGGAIERSWRRMRPDPEGLPWRELDPRTMTPELVRDARIFWTRAALAEHRAAAATAAVQRALVEARAPIDLIATGGGFVLDELFHVELCARVANRLGGAAAIKHDPDGLVPAVDPAWSPLLRAAALVLDVNCVSETFLLAMQRLNKREQKHPLVRTLLARITRDEAAHARFGWLFFDWAEPLLDAVGRERLQARARRTIAAHVSDRASTAAQDEAGLGWMSPRQFRDVAATVMEESVCAPLRERGLL